MLFRSRQREREERRGEVGTRAGEKVYWRERDRRERRADERQRDRERTRGKGGERETVRQKRSLEGEQHVKIEKTTCIIRV